MDAAPAPTPTTRRQSVLPAALGGALLALAGHAELLRRFGTVLPYRDQWKATAVDLLGPWSSGHLRAGHFFAPLNDHWPVLTRGLSFLLVRVNGQWNNLVETSVNALLLALTVALFLRCVLPAVGSRLRPFFALLTGALFALPITWENTLWGIQSLVYLQILLTVVYLDAVCSAQTLSRRWWIGHVAGLLVLFTQHSGVLAHVAAALLLSWRWWRGDGDPKVRAITLGFAVAAIALFVLFFPPLSVTAAFRADSWELALDVFLRQLGWPLPHPGWAFFVYLPWLAWSFDRFHARRLWGADAFIIAGGLWVGSQAAAIGYGRGAETYTFVSRYCDILALGWLLNAACLIRLWLRFERRDVRVVLVLLGALWVLAPVRSFRWESTESHAGYNLTRRPGENERNLAVLRRYFTSHDQAAFNTAATPELYTYPPETIPLLDNPRIAALLPPETGAPGARPDHGRLGWLPAVLLPSATIIAATGLVLLVLAWPRRRLVAPIPEFTTVPPTSLVIFGGAIWLTSLGVLVAWEHPTRFTHSQRVQAVFHPVDHHVAVHELVFDRVDGISPVPIDATAGVETEPPEVRDYLYGTRLRSDPEFRGILSAQPIELNAHYLTVPFTGYPCSSGNGLRWHLVDPATVHETWISYVGPNPGTNLDFWTIDVSAYPGNKAALVLFDGRDGSVGGWSGVGPVVQTAEPKFAEAWRRSIRRLRADHSHSAVATLFAILTLGLPVGFLVIRRSSKPHRSPA
jgi:hypothetical protein